jgi:hypothetical protein
MAMADDNGSDPVSAVDRVFAGMLGELEDAETQLVVEQDRLAKELQRVQAELDRLQAAKAAMMGAPQRRKPGPKPGSATRTSNPSYGAGKADANRKAVLEWARTLDAGTEFTGGEVSEALNMPTMGTGPILSGMAKAGMLRRREERKSGRTWRYYSLPTVETAEAE